MISFIKASVTDEVFSNVLQTFKLIRFNEIFKKNTEVQF